MTWRGETPPPRATRETPSRDATPRDARASPPRASAARPPRPRPSRRRRVSSIRATRGDARKVAFASSSPSRDARDATLARVRSTEETRVTSPRDTTSPSRVAPIANERRRRAIVASRRAIVGVAARDRTPRGRRARRRRALDQRVATPRIATEATIRTTRRRLRASSRRTISTPRTRDTRGDAWPSSSPFAPTRGTPRGYASSRPTRRTRGAFGVVTRRGGIDPRDESRRDTRARRERRRATWRTRRLRRVDGIAPPRGEASRAIFYGRERRRPIHPSPAPPRPRARATRRASPRREVVDAPRRDASTLGTRGGTRDSERDATCVGRATRGARRAPANLSSSSSREAT